MPFKGRNEDFKAYADLLRNQKEEMEGHSQKTLAANQELQNEIANRRAAEEDLEAKMKELEDFNNMAVGRELRMIKLKQEINGLLSEHGLEPKHEIAE